MHEIYLTYIDVQGRHFLFFILKLFYTLKEKKRIQLRLEPPGHENSILDNYVPIFRYCRIIYINLYSYVLLKNYKCL